MWDIKYAIEAIAQTSELCNVGVRVEGNISWAAGLLRAEENLWSDSGFSAAKAHCLAE
jgi:hypothetical protein